MTPQGCREDPSQRELLGGGTHFLRPSKRKGQGTGRADSRNYKSEEEMVFIANFHGEMSVESKGILGKLEG